MTFFDGSVKSTDDFHPSYHLTDCPVTPHTLPPTSSSCPNHVPLSTAPRLAVTPKHNIEPRAHEDTEKDTDSEEYKDSQEMQRRGEDSSSTVSSYGSASESGLPEDGRGGEHRAEGRACRGAKSRARGLSAALQAAHIKAPCVP